MSGLSWSGGREERTQGQDHMQSLQHQNYSCSSLPECRICLCLLFLPVCLCFWRSCYHTCSCIMPVFCASMLLMTSCRDPGVLPRQEPDEEWLQARKPRWVCLWWFSRICSSVHKQEAGWQQQQARGVCQAATPPAAVRLIFIFGLL